MAQVLGLGGIFFKSKDRKALTEWYGKWLNIPVDVQGYVSLIPDSLPNGSYSVWGPFKQDTGYFEPSSKEFMINLIVDDLKQALAQVVEGGAELSGAPEQTEYGRYGWFIDPDGNKVELWQPSGIIPGQS